MRRRNNYDKNFKARVAIEALKNEKTMSQLASEFKVHTNQISKWKKEFLANASAAFDKTASQATDPEEVKKLYEQIGRMKIEIDFLKKNL